MQQEPLVVLSRPQFIYLIATVYFLYNSLLYDHYNYYYYTFSKD